MFTREAAVAPRRASFFVARTLFVGTLFALTLTAWQMLVGSQRLESIGDLAWFGAAAFQILAPFQLAVALPFSALLVASAVAIEKDRKTLDLMLLTSLSNSELVLGKLLAGMLSVIVVVVASLPLFMIIALLGGISREQILRVEAVTLASALLAGSLGSMVALWREKTFQALAMTMLVLVIWLLGWEIVASVGADATWLGLPARSWSIAMSPWQAVQEAAQPIFDASRTNELRSDPVLLFLITSIVASAALNLVAIVRLRVWNPSREVAPRLDEERELVDSDAIQFNSKTAVAIHSAGGNVRN